MKPSPLVGLNQKRNSDFKEKKKKVMGETMLFHALVHLKKTRDAYIESDDSVLVMIECDFTLPASASYS